MCVFVLMMYESLSYSLRQLTCTHHQKHTPARTSSVMCVYSHLSVVHVFHLKFEELHLIRHIFHVNTKKVCIKSSFALNLDFFPTQNKKRAPFCHHLTVAVDTTSTTFFILCVEAQDRRGNHLNHGLLYFSLKLNW